MTHTLLRRQALILRQKGKSYSQIKTELGLSKSTLSEWLRNFPLSREQIAALSSRSPQRIERFRQTMWKKRQKRLEAYYNDEKQKWLPLSQKELYIAGLFLYWGEGTKSGRGMVNISNTDPMVIKFALYWLIYCLRVPIQKIRVLLHLYSDMNVDQELEYWSEELQITKNLFVKPYIKTSTRKSLDEKGHGHGTCDIRVANTVLKEKIMMGIKAIGDYYSVKLKEALV